MSLIHDVLGMKTAEEKLWSNLWSRLVALCPGEYSEHDLDGVSKALPPYCKWECITNPGGRLGWRASISFPVHRWEYSSEYVGSERVARLMCVVAAWEFYKVMVKGGPTP